MEPIVFREDPLAKLDDASTYQDKLAIIHHIMKKRCAGIDRISIALLDRQTQTLKTFIAVPADENPLKNYEAVIETKSALAEIAKSGRPRVVNDLRVYENHDSHHSRVVVRHGYASSYTHPVYYNRDLAGFVFFNSYHNRYFRDRNLEQVEIFTHLITAMIINDLSATHALLAAVRTSVEMVQKHDFETGAHLERMSRYSRLIARSMVKKGVAESLADEQIEQITLFAPLHDVGKIGIPDRILRKPARLTREEREVMNNHPLLGRQIVDEMIGNFGFERVPHIDFLKHIVESHHEAMDGSGYPHGMCGQEIPLEARIIAVSDIFDALTSQRPYKASWSNEHAFAMLQLLSIDKLDKDCVDSLIDCPAEIDQIQQRFSEAQ